MSDDKRSEMTDRGFAIMALALTVFVGWLKYKTEIITFYFQWRYGVALVITLAIMATYVKIRKKFTSLFKESDLENEILSPTEGEDSVFAGITPRVSLFSLSSPLDGCTRKS